MLKKIKKFWFELFHKKIHTSWLIASVSGGFLAGVGLSLTPKTAVFSQVFFLLFAVLFLIPIFTSRLRIMVIFAIFAGLSIGLWRGTLTRVDLNSYGDYLGQNVILRGVVKEDPDFGPSHDLRVRLVNVEVILQADYDKLSAEEVDNLDQYFTLLPGQIWASAFARGGIEVKRSDAIEITGKLKSGFGTFPASMSYASISKVTRSPGADPMRDLRDGFGDQLRKVIPEPAADLGMGILAGQKTALPLDLSTAFLVASLTHIVVASGYNLTILVRFARRLFAKISRFAALGFSGGLVFAFACVTGFSPSMTRASLVAGLSLLAWYYGRKFHPVVLLTMVAAITIVVDPMQLWGDAGWYMSFLSFVGVIILAPLIKSYFWGDKPEISKKPPLRTRILAKVKTNKDKENLAKPVEKSHPIRQIFIETTSAQLMAAPIIALFMGNFSPYGLLANLLVLWLLPLTMLLTFIAGIGAFILPPFLAQIVAWPATQLLNYVIYIAHQIANLPGASIAIQPSLLTTSAIFVAILAAIFYLRFKTERNLRDSGNVVE